MSFRNHVFLPGAMGMCLNESDHVLVCEHLSKTNRFTLKSAFRAGSKFTRDDGTEGNVRVCVVCEDCREIPPKDVLYMEYFWGDGRLHMYDGHVCPECREAGVTPQ